jgi:hypothetical protein
MTVAVFALALTIGGAVHALSAQWPFAEPAQPGTASASGRGAGVAAGASSRAAAVR